MQCICLHHSAFIHVIDYKLRLKSSGFTCRWKLSGCAFLWVANECLYYLKFKEKQGEKITRSSFTYQLLTACLVSTCQRSHSVTTVLIQPCCIFLYVLITAVIRGVLLLCKHCAQAAGEPILIQRASSQPNAEEPCDVRLINSVTLACSCCWLCRSGKLNLSFFT